MPHLTHLLNCLYAHTKTLFKFRSEYNWLLHSCIELAYINFRMLFLDLAFIDTCLVRVSKCPIDFLSTLE